MKFKRFFLRHSLNFQKIKIKARNLDAEDFQKAYIVVSKRLYRVIHLRNLVAFCLVFIIVVFSMFISSFNTIEAFYNKDNPLSGGTYAEGNLGKFSRINPLYSQTNPNDEDAVNLIFSGLMKRGDNRSLKTDMASKWTLSEDKKTYTFELKKGVKWHDGVEFSADDVLFTIELIQNPDARSSLYEAWKGVKAEKTEKGEVKFTLGEPSDSFLENTTLKILPKHILAKIPPASIQTVDFNTKPVGTGPYEFDSLTKESGRETLIMSLNDKYYDKKPYLTKVMLESFLDEKEMMDEYNKRNIKGIGNPTQGLVDKIGKEGSTSLHEYALPRYVAMFFNVESEKLKEKNLRVAINQAVDRKDILEKAAEGRALPAYYPIAPGLASQTGIKVESKGDIGKASETLKGASYTLESGQLKYQGKDVTLKIATGDTVELKKTAEIVADELKKLGIKTEIKSENMNVLQKDYIRPRNYDILIIGEDLGLTPDLFSFWHSSQVNDPGLNFSKYKDRKLDKFIEVARKTTDATEKKSKLEEIQKIILEDVPAVYLYNPFYVFITSDKVKGVRDGKMISPSDRFEDIENWYLKADRVMIDG
ncbi:MAG: peptide ABC transporter substrate-binding protein [bacterium]|nr:peptide ABC transporter substrate-binding protein [bacterium]